MKKRIKMYDEYKLNLDMDRSTITLYKWIDQTNIIVGGRNLNPVDYRFLDFAIENKDMFNNFTANDYDVYEYRFGGIFSKYNTFDIDDKILLNYLSPRDNKQDNEIFTKYIQYINDNENKYKDYLIDLDKQYKKKKFNL